jgi:hypothetical protein
MKNKLRPTITILLAALILVSCDLPQAGGGGSLTVVLPGGNQSGGTARSMLSDGLIAALRYHITLTGPGGETIEREAAGGRVAVDVSPGTWTITVDAYDAAISIGTGTETVTVVPGQPAAVSIKMTVDPGYESGLMVFYIHNEAELRAYMADPTLYNRTNHTALLERDISVSGSPVGSLYGTLDGQGHTITLNINADGGKVGLLEENSGTVRNLKLIGTVTGTYNSGASAVGAVAGENAGSGTKTIENVSSAVVVTAFNTASGTAAFYTGGIAGLNAGTIQDCSAGEPVTASRTVGTLGDANTGGIAGRNDGTIRRCYAWGNVSSSYPSGSTSAGGIAGYNGGAVNQCAALNSVVNSAAGSIALGRIVGNNSGSLNNNHAYELMQVGSTTSPVTAGGIHGGDLTDAFLAIDNMTVIWSSVGSLLDWSPTITGTAPSSSEPPSGTSPWWWAKSITILANDVAGSTLVTALVPVLWFE